MNQNELACFEALFYEAAATLATTTRDASPGRQATGRQALDTMMLLNDLLKDLSMCNDKGRDAERAVRNLRIQRALAQESKADLGAMSMSNGEALSDERTDFDCMTNAYRAYNRGQMMAEHLVDEDNTATSF